MKVKPLEKKYLQEIKECLSNYKNIAYAFIFGSALKGLRRDSDIDVFLGGKIDFALQCELMAELTKITKRKVDIVVYDKAGIILRMQGFSKGKVLLINDKAKLKKDYFAVFYAYGDAEKIMKMRMARVRREYNG